LTSETRKHPGGPVGANLRDWRADAHTDSRPLVAIGLGVIVGLVLVGLSIFAGALVVHTVSAALFSGGPGQIRSASGFTTAGQQSLKVQSSLIERRHAAIAAYAATLTEFKRVTARPPGVAGINLDAAEGRRRDDVLTSLVLECIDAVDGYNLAAQAVPVAQLRSAGVPERYAWAVDCAFVQ
jgi:hypothetical protein